MLPVTDHGTGPYDRFVRANRPRIALPVGAVDRDSGVFRTQRGAQRDLRNVLLRDGTAHLRPGMADTILFTDNAYIVLGMEYLPYSNELIVVTADPLGSVDVWSVAGLGATPVPIGNWFTYDPALDPRPVITLAESYNKIFMAHDEAVLTNRAPTFCYDPDAGVGVGLTLGPLTADWARGGEVATPENIKLRFRGVVAYLDYLIGWGFGNNKADRPELIRTSLPGEPLKANGDAGFDPMHYAVVGSRGEPVISCAPAGNGLLIFKQHEIHPLLGTSPQTFGVGPAVDHHHGMAGANLWTNMNGVLYFWSEEGPRATTGGASEDLAIPLDLDGPLPDTMAESVYRTGFAIHVPEKRVVLFVFEDWAYALDVRGGKPAGWSYWSLGAKLVSGAIWREPQVGEGAAPAAGPIFDSLIEASATTLLLQVLNPDGTDPEFPVANTGSEFIETWYRVLGSGGAYTLGNQKLADQPGSMTQILLVGLSPDTQYEIAFRYRLNNQYHASYGTNLQASWPAASKTVQTTLQQEALQTGWQRTSVTTEVVNLAWEVSEYEPESTERTIEKHVGLEPVQDPNEIPPGDWTLVDTQTNAVPPTYVYDVLPGEEEQYIYFRVRLTSETTGQVMLVWTGPKMPYNLTVPVPPNGDFSASTEENAANWSGRPWLWITESINQDGDRHWVADVYTAPDDEALDGVSHGVQIQLQRLLAGTSTVEATLDTGNKDVIRDGTGAPDTVRGLSPVAGAQWTGDAEFVGGGGSGWNETGDIKANRDYRARVRAVSVRGPLGTETMADYLLDPTGMVLDYSPWSSYTNRWAIPFLP